MKVVHRDENTLILRPDDLWIKVLEMLIFGVFILWVLVESGTKSHLTCQRMQGDQIPCQLEYTFLGLTRSYESFNNLRSARLEGGHGRSGNFYLVILTMDDAEWPFPHSDCGYRTGARMTQEINTFLQSPSLTHLNVSQNTDVLFWFAVTFWLSAYSFAIHEEVQTRFITWTFDRTQNRITYRHRTLFGVKTTEYPLYDIKGVRVATMKLRNCTMYRIELLRTRYGEDIPLTSWYRSKESSASQAAYVISRFLYSNPPI